MLARSILKAWFVPLRRSPVRCRVVRPAVVVPLLLCGLISGCTSLTPADVGSGDAPPAAIAQPTGELVAAPAASLPDTQAGQPEELSFQDVRTYADGMRVAVTEVRHSRLPAVSMADRSEPGSPMLVLSVLVQNAGEKPLRLDEAAALLAYGPDGESGDTPFGNGVVGLSGELAPGESQTGSVAFVVPEKYWDRVTLEVYLDRDHESAVFTGPVAPR